MRRFNLSLDDMSPHPKAGLNFESIGWCDKLIDKYPDFKVNLFIPAAYCRLGEHPCYLTEHMEWVEKVKRLPQNNYRVNLHGLFHRRTDGENPDSNNDEFQYLKGSWADTYIDTMVNEFERAGLAYHKTFRPPGWKISSSAAKILTSRGFVVAGNKDYYQLFKGKIGKLKWVSYNYDMVGDIPEGYIIAYGHTSNWTNNYMNEERFNLLDNILSKDQFSFKFIEELL